MVTEEESSRGLSVADAMLTDFHTLPLHAPLKRAVELLIAGTQHDFPIVDEHGKCVGLLLRKSLIAGLAEKGSEPSVAEFMTEHEESALPSEALAEGMAKLRGSANPMLPVIDTTSGKLVGLLTSENIGEVLMIRDALRQIRVA